MCTLLLIGTKVMYENIFIPRLSDDFSIHPNTKLVGSVSVGSTVLTVDSTVGFGTTAMTKDLVVLDINNVLGLDFYWENTAFLRRCGFEKCFLGSFFKVS